MNLPVANKTSDPSSSKTTLSDYKIMRSLGEGAFGEVYLVKHLIKNKIYALKSINKSFLAKQRKEHHVFQEKLILQSLNLPFLVKLYATFQDESKLYFLMEYIQNGELSKYIRIKSGLIRKSKLE